MAENTTISLPESLKDDLDGLKEHEDEPYWKVVRRLIADHNKQVMDGHNDGGPDLSDEIKDQLDRIESSAQTAEERTGEIERTLEGLQQ